MRLEVRSVLKLGIERFKRTFLPLFIGIVTLSAISTLVAYYVKEYVILESLSVADISNIVFSLFTMAFTIVAFDKMERSQRLTFTGIADAVSAVVWPLFLLYLVWIVIGMVLMLFVGLFKPLWIVAALLFVYLFIKFSLAVFYVVIDRDAVMKAFDRSFMTTQGNFWNITLIYLYLVLFATGVIVLARFLLSATSDNLLVENLQPFSWQLVSVQLFASALIVQHFYAILYTLYRALHTESEFSA